MKTTIYTYRNEKVVLLEADKYYYVENKKQLDEVIDNLIQIDAVSSPSRISYPCILKLKSGFGCELELADKYDVQRDLAKLKTQLKTLTGMNQG